MADVRGGLWAGRPSLSKKVCSPLGPLCEGAPPAGGGGENCTAARNISGYGKVLSLRPFGAPPSQREVFRHAAAACGQAALRIARKELPDLWGVGDAALYSGEPRAYIPQAYLSTTTAARRGKLPRRAAVYCA